MKYQRIVRGLTDTDLYKFNMLQVIFNRHTDLTGVYEFVCRNKGVKFTDAMVDEIRQQVDALCNLRFTDKEIDYLRTIRFLKPGFVEFLRFWYPRREYVGIGISREADCGLKIEVRGPLFAAMMFEIYLLEIVSEVYYRETYNWEKLSADFVTLTDEKVKKFQNSTYTFKFADFGCRRRFSYELEEYAVNEYAKCGALIGTSNVMLAMNYNLKPIGTMAHEMFQMYQGIPSIPLAYTTKACLDEWYDVYQGDNGVALTDTLTTDLFLLDFDRKMAATFTGVRNDSGDPYEWGERMIKHWKSLNIDPKTKTLLFSNSLTLDEAQALYDYFKDKAMVGFGIGGHICTEAPGVTPLNIVIKLQYVDGQPVAKISDDEGKTLCQDKEYIDYLKNAIKFRLNRGRKR